MREDKEQLLKNLKRICDGLLWYLKGFSEDGACMEGLGYYTYGMAYFVNFAQELYEYSDGKWDLFCGEWGEFKAGKEDKRTKMAQFPAKCFFPDLQCIIRLSHFRILTGGRGFMMTAAIVLLH